MLGGDQPGANERKRAIVACDPSDIHREGVWTICVIVKRAERARPQAFHVPGVEEFVRRDK